MRKKVLSCLPALSVLCLLAACVPGLSDDAGLYFGRGSGSIPISEGQTTEVHIRDTLPRYLGIIEEVVVESGGVLEVGGKNRVDGCLTTDTTDMDIDWMMMVIPAIDYEDLRRMVVEGAQRNGFGYSWDPVRRDKLNSRTVTVGDGYGNKLSFYHHEAKDSIVISLYSGCMLPSQPLDPDVPLSSYPLPSPEEMFPNLTIVQAFDDNGDENPGLRPQSGTQSGE
jgi:putative citrate lyase acyl carrier protein